MDMNLHRLNMLGILKDIYSDPTLCNCLAFKGGTSLMFLYGLPRFSVDLDFNLLDLSKQGMVFEKIKEIAGKYGSLYDAQEKFFGPVVVLDYGKGERKLKLEISNREYGNSYEMKSYLGINMQVMRIEDMFAHKLCALTDRDGLTGRDVFDIWFFLQGKYPVNKNILETRTGMAFEDYLTKCEDTLEHAGEKKIMQDIGELLTPQMKAFVKNSLKAETTALLSFFKAFPLISENSPEAMTIDNATVSTRNDGSSFITARIAGFDCPGEKIKDTDLEFYKRLAKEEDKRKCAVNLARKYYADWWRRTYNKKDRKSVRKR